jgi:hypothetical protein
MRMIGKVEPTPGREERTGEDNGRQRIKPGGDHDGALGWKKEETTRTRRKGLARGIRCRHGLAGRMGGGECV